MTNFDTAINRLLTNEGGLVDNPNDPGGLTQWGISQRSYPTVNIRALTRDDAIAIYRRDFWVSINGDALPPGIGFQALDFAVNSNIQTAIRKLQAAAGVADDGHWGPVTQAAVATLPASVLAMRFLAERLDFMRALSTWPSFGRGWAGRIAADLRYGATDVAGSVAS